MFLEEARTSKRKITECQYKQPGKVVEPGGGGLRSGEQDLIPVGPGLPPAYLLGSFGAYLDGSWLGAEADRDVSWKGARRVVTWTPRSD